MPFFAVAQKDTCPVETAATAVTATPVHLLAQEIFGETSLDGTGDWPSALHGMQMRHGSAQAARVVSHVGAILRDECGSYRPYWQQRPHCSARYDIKEVCEVSHVDPEVLPSTGTTVMIGRVRIGVSGGCCCVTLKR
jgi:hypothetical protein